ncbi:MAG TPA: response regulator [Candidatus Anoxymicrobiaceae bacterium]|jgi:diguanylate cyclase (GGDEF)-like protein
MLQPRPKVLVADDDHNLRQLLMEALPKHKFEVYQAADGKEAWDTVKNLRPDIVLLDVMMPGIDGHEVCRMMRDNPQTRNIPVIMLTAKAQLKDKLDGIESGADDYITKPFDPMELQARIEMHLRRYLRDSDMSPITELPGNKAIEQALSERVESGRKFALLYVDLDDFKAFNDYYGFTAGSEVIRMTGDVLAEAIEQNRSGDDFLGHVGGDDFVVLTPIESAEAVSKDIIRLFDERIRNHYSPEDLDKGYIVSIDRRGYVMKFPVMTISISIVHNDNRPLTDPGQIGRIAAELKKYAKDLEGSVYVFDRRKA